MSDYTPRIVHFAFYKSTGRCDFYPRDLATTTAWERVTCPRCIWRHDGDEQARSAWHSFMGRERHRRCRGYWR